MTNPLTILHVDDDPNDILLVQRAGRKAGLSLKVQSVNDGDQALAYLNGEGTYTDRQKYPLPSLILLDLKMPRKSGLEVLSWIRSQPQLRRIIVSILTSSRHDEDINRAYDIGVNAYLVKPVGFESLVELITMVHDYWLDLNEQPTFE